MIIDNNSKSLSGDNSLVINPSKSSGVQPTSTSVHNAIQNWFH